MNIFISWSGIRSNAIAQACQRFIPLVLQQVRLISSESDIEKGERWSNKLRYTVDAADVALLVITPENLNNPWLAFEAGTLSTKTKSVESLLVDLSPADLPMPFAQFQALTLSRTDMHRFLASLNSRLDPPLPSNSFDTLFEVMWPKFQQELEGLPEASPPETHAGKSAVSASLRRPDRELLEEVLTLVRQISAELSRKP